MNNPAALAAIHARCFTEAPRPWSASDIAATLAGPGAFLLTAGAGFLIGRAIAGEAELLTLAVAPEARRQGLASALLIRFKAAALADGARAGFLEVASDNATARALYRATGWVEVGLRRNYYAPGIDALIMTRDFSQDH